MRIVALLLALLVLPPAASPSSGATLFRLFLSDGTALVSYGEFARVNDRVVFSMPVGGTGAEPRLHVVTIPASVVDWTRTERYSASARYQHYATTRGEEDFARLSGDVARVLNEIALTTDPARALQIAEQARKTMADWPEAHYGYRQRDVREIVSLLDEAISDLRAAANVGAFDLSLVASVADVELVPLLDMPPPREIMLQLITVARLAERSAERVSLLQAALAMVNDRAAGLGREEASTLRDTIALQIRDEIEVDNRYARLSRRMLADASRAAARARVRDVEAILARVAREDARLGGRRPEVVEALNASVQSKLDAARRLRLLRDQWALRRGVYRRYERSIGSELMQLVKAQPALDAIKRLEGPRLGTLASLVSRLSGGAERLKRLDPPEEMRSVHDLLVSAWHFAENAIKTRQGAIASGNLDTAWEASSSAAGALMLLSRAQGEIRTLLEPPRLR
jgi:hypothetical protein